MYSNPVGTKDKRGQRGPYFKNVTRTRPVSGIQDFTFSLRGGGLLITSVKKPVLESSFIGKYSRFVGTTYFRVGTQPPRAYHNSLSFIRYVNRFARKISKRIMSSIINTYLEARVVVEGAFSTNSPSFAAMARGSPMTNSVKAEVMLKEICKAGLPYLSLPIIDDGIHPHTLDNLDINIDSFPGVMTTNYFGRKRDVTLPYSLEASKKLFNFIKQRAVKYSGIWAVFGREKDIKLTEDGVLKGNRPVLAPEECLNLIAGAVGQLVTAGIRSYKDNSFYIGKSFDGRAWEDFYSEVSDFFSILSADFKKFDVHIDEETMLASCAILRACFPETDEYNRIFYFIATSLIFKTVAFPPGILIEIRNGLPSGHPLTSLVGCLASYIHWTRALYYAYGYKVTSPKIGPLWKIRICSDDVEMLLSYKKNLLSRLDWFMNNRTPLECDPCHDNYHPIRTTVFSCASVFLKRSMTSDGLVSWSVDSICRKLVYPTSELKHIDDILDWVLHWIDSAAGDSDLIAMLHGYYKFLLKEHRAQLEPLIFSIHKRIYLQKFASVHVRGYLRTSTKMQFQMTLTGRRKKRVKVYESDYYGRIQVLNVSVVLQIASLIDSNAYIRNVIKSDRSLWIPALHELFVRARDPPRRR